MSMFSSSVPTTLGAIGGTTGRRPNSIRPIKATPPAATLPTLPDDVFAAPSSFSPQAIGQQMAQPSPIQDLGIFDQVSPVGSGMQMATPRQQQQRALFPHGVPQDPKQLSPAQHDFVQRTTQPQVDQANQQLRPITDAHSQYNQQVAGSMRAAPSSNQVAQSRALPVTGQERQDQLTQQRRDIGFSPGPTRTGVGARQGVHRLPNGQIYDYDHNTYVRPTNHPTAQQTQQWADARAQSQQRMDARVASPSGVAPESAAKMRSMARSMGLTADDVVAAGGSHRQLIQNLRNQGRIPRRNSNQSAAILMMGQTGQLEAEKFQELMQGGASPGAAPAPSSAPPPAPAAPQAPVTAGPAPTPLPTIQRPPQAPQTQQAANPAMQRMQTVPRGAVPRSLPVKRASAQEEVALALRGMLAKRAEIDEETPQRALASLRLKFRGHVSGLGALAALAAGGYGLSAAHGAVNAPEGRKLEGARRGIGSLNATLGGGLLGGAAGAGLGALAGTQVDATGLGALAGGAGGLLLGSNLASSRFNKNNPAPGSEEEQAKTAAEIVHRKRQAPIVHSLPKRLVFGKEELDAPSTSDIGNWQDIADYMTAVAPHQLSTARVFTGNTNPNDLIKQVDRHRGQDTFLEDLFATREQAALQYSAMPRAMFAQFPASYHPLANSVVMNERSPGALIHELGHGVDLAPREHEAKIRRYLRWKLKPLLWKEFSGWRKGREAYQRGFAAAPPEEREQKLEQYRKNMESYANRKFPAFGTYLGGTAGMAAGLAGGFLANRKLDGRANYLPMLGMVGGGMLGSLGGALGGKAYASATKEHQARKAMEQLERLLRRGGLEEERTQLDAIRARRSSSSKGEEPSNTKQRKDASAADDDSWTRSAFDGMRLGSMDSFPDCLDERKDQTQADVGAERRKKASCQAGAIAYRDEDAPADQQCDQASFESRIRRGLSVAIVHPNASGPVKRARSYRGDPTAPVRVHAIKIAANPGGPAIPEIPAARNALQTGVLDKTRGLGYSMLGAPIRAGEAIARPLSRVFGGTQTWDPSKPGGKANDGFWQRFWDADSPQQYQQRSVGGRMMESGVKDMAGVPAEGYGSHVSNLNAQMTHGGGAASRYGVGALNLAGHALPYVTGAKALQAIPGAGATFQGARKALPAARAWVGRQSPWVRWPATAGGVGGSLLGATAMGRGFEQVAEAAGGQGVGESPADVARRTLNQDPTPQGFEQAYWSGENQIRQQEDAGRLTPQQRDERLHQLDRFAETTLAPQVFGPQRALMGPQQSQDPSPSLPVRPYLNPFEPQQPQIPATPSQADAVVRTPQPQPGQSSPNLFSMEGVKHLGQVFQNLPIQQQLALLLGGGAALYGGGQALSGNGGLGNGIMGLLGLGAGAYGLHGLMKGWNGEGIAPTAPGANPGGVSNPVDPNAALGNQAGNLQPDTIKAIVETLADPNMPPARAQQIVKALPLAQRQQAQKLLKAYMGNDYKAIADLYPDAMPPGVQTAYEYLPDDWVNAGIGMTGIPDSRAAEYGITRQNAPQLDALLSSSGGGGFGT